MSVVGLVDVRCMFVSCERVINPRLEGRPVVVLSNNDGCVVSRAQQAKDLGIAMGQPWFEISRSHPHRHEIVGCSSNYELYADMSRRLVSAIASLVADVESYSIDECFVVLGTHPAPAVQARRIAERVLQWTGLPVTIGLRSTKTLAKIAQHRAKASAEPTSVCDLSSDPDQLAEVLAATDVEDVWGVGWRLTEHLRGAGVRTAADLAAADLMAIWHRHSVVLARTVLELRGQPALSFDELPPPRRQIMHGRMLGAPVTTRADMRSALTEFAARATRRLLAQGNWAWPGRCTDRAFLARDMPTLEGHLHYRIVDVSIPRETGALGLLTGLVLAAIPVFPVAPDLSISTCDTTRAVDLAAAGQPGQYSPVSISVGGTLSARCSDQVDDATATRLASG